MATHTTDSSLAPLPKDLIDQDKAAAMMFLSRLTLTNWRTRGIGPPYYKVGRNALYSEAEIAKWMNARRIVPDDGKQEVA